MVVRAGTSSRTVRLLPRALAGALVGVAAWGAVAVGVAPPAVAASPRATVDRDGAERPVGPARRPLRIMPLGDSITAGVGSPSRSSYRADLRRRLVAAGLAVDFVGSQRSGAGPDTDHEGHGGWTIDRIAAQLDGWLAAYQPDVVLVHLGTNNITRGESPAVTAAKLSALVEQIRTDRPQAQILLAQIIGSKVGAELAADHAYNTLVRGVAAAAGPGVTLVDQSGVNGIDLLDLHHPNDFGYAKMSYTFYRALERIYAAPGRAWPAGVNPYAQRSAVRCLWRPVHRAGRVQNLTECRRWTLRTVQRRVGGFDTVVQRWQTRRVVTESYPATVGGRRVTKTRQVRRWVGPELFLRF